MELDWPDDLTVIWLLCDENEKNLRASFKLVVVGYMTGELSWELSSKRGVLSMIVKVQ